MKIIIWGTDQSATVCWDFGLDGVAFHTNEFGILAAVHAEGVAPGNSGEGEEAKAPEDSHTADGLSGDLSGLFSACGAGRAVASSVVAATNGDNSGASLLGRRSVHGLRSHHHRLTVHLCFI